MNIIALDTSTQACSAALMLGDDLIQRFEIAPQQHSNLILPMIDSLLDEAGVSLTNIDAIAFGRGPGSFVGVRIAAGVTQGIAYGADLPVIPVSSLAACAQGLLLAKGSEKAAEKVLVAFDARMNQIYWGPYIFDDAGIARLQGQEQVINPDAVILPADGDGWVGAGDGWRVYADVLRKNVQIVTQWQSDAYPQAKGIARIGAADFLNGKAVAAENAIPIYLRDNVARKQIVVSQK